MRRTEARLAAATPSTSQRPSGRMQDRVAGPRYRVLVVVRPISPFRGQGVQPGVALTDNAALEAIMLDG